MDNKYAAMCILLNSVSTERWKVGIRQSEVEENCGKKEFLVYNLSFLSDKSFHMHSNLFKNIGLEI